jgi:hypothetical protein
MPKNIDLLSHVALQVHLGQNFGSMITLSFETYIRFKDGMF